MPSIFGGKGEEQSKSVSGGFSVSVKFWLFIVVGVVFFFVGFGFHGFFYPQNVDSPDHIYVGLNPDDVTVESMLGSLSGIRSDLRSFGSDLNVVTANQVAIFSMLQFASCVQARDVNGSVVFVSLVDAVGRGEELDLGGGVVQRVLVFDGIVWLGCLER